MNRQDVPPIVANTVAKFPAGWFRVRTSEGRPAGFGFCCKRCGLFISHHASATVRHCGKDDALPVDATLPDVVLPAYGRRKQLAGDRILLEVNDASGGFYR